MEEYCRLIESKITLEDIKKLRGEKRTEKKILIDIKDHINFFLKLMKTAKEFHIGSRRIKVMRMLSFPK